MPSTTIQNATNLSQHPKQMSVNHPERIAVLLTSYGGVQTYDQFTQYNKRASEYIAAKFAPIPSWLYSAVARILTLRDLFKWGYKHEHFTSPQNDIFENQRRGIEQHLQEQWGEGVQVFTGFYFCEPFVEDVLVEIKNKGFNKILIFPLLVVDSVFTSSIAIEQVNQALEQETEAKEPWLKHVRYIPSFHNKPDYINFTTRQLEAEIDQHLDNKFLPYQIGVIPACHGSPQKTQGLVTGLEDGQELYEQVRSQLVNHYPLMSIGWINHETPFLKWTEPTLEQAAKNLIELGAKAIVFKPIGWATDNYETILDVEEAIKSVRDKYPDITYIRLNCANDHPDFLKMAADWANPEIECLRQVAVDQ